MEFSTRVGITRSDARATMR